MSKKLTALIVGIGFAGVDLVIGVSISWLWYSLSGSGLVVSALIIITTIFLIISIYKQIFWVIDIWNEK